MDNLIKAYGLDKLAVGADYHFPPHLDDLPVAFYATNCDGDIIYYNRAAVLIWGRVPEKGHDKWCAHYDLYTTEGRFIPRETCAMAMAAKHGLTLRGIEAVAVRHNGSAFRFLPYPTPLRNGQGDVVGAFNMVLYLGEIQLAATSAEIDFQAAL